MYSDRNHWFWPNNINVWCSASFDRPVWCGGKSGSCYRQYVWRWNIGVWTESASAATASFHVL